MSALRTSLWTALVALVGCGSPLVGLTCQDGLERCGSSCFDLSSDSLHCGGCGIACGADQHCEQSMCVAGAVPDAGRDAGLDGSPGEPDATVLADGHIVGPDGETLLPDGAVILDDGAIVGPDGAIVGMDGSTDADGSLDGADGSLDGTDGASDGGGDTDAMVQPPVLCTGVGSPDDCVCGIGTTKCGTSCVDLNADHENCGMCGNACAADEFCNLGMCDLICTPPVVLCNGQCVDFSSDDNNCGGCNMPCTAAAQCIDSTCVGAAVGHVIAIGHDMTGVLRPAIRQLVGNAVFLAPRSPVRTLVYDAATSVASRAGVSAAIAAASATVGRAVATTTALPATVTAQLATADVFVIEPQQGASDAELNALGTSWSAALSSFLFRGGVVVVFDGGPDSGDLNAGTWQTMHAASTGMPPSPLFDASGTMLLSPRILANVRPADAIGANVPTEYLSSGETVGFTLNANPARPHNVVIRDTGGTTPSDLPVVVHVVFEP